jgi:hypothetical protein
MITTHNGEPMPIDLVVFSGNCPGNVNKDAKYHVKSDGSVAVPYKATDEELWWLSTELHRDLVDMVNGVKGAAGFGRGGAFYINEYQQVLVPTGAPATYYLAGEYHPKLKFQFETKTLTGEPVSAAGAPLKAGDRWEGPHPGIPYVLTASGADIKYSYEPRPNVETTVKLSKRRGVQIAKDVAAQIRPFKAAGGRFYVNEHCAMFAPVASVQDQTWTYVYVGQIDLASWFPKWLPGGTM